MATIIEQEPLFTRMPVGQKIIYTLSNSAIVATELRVKFVAKVYITSGIQPIIGVDTPIGTFKTIPNNKGVGIFDFSELISNYVNSDNLSTDKSTYKKLGQPAGSEFAIHLIDRFSKNTNSCKHVTILFSIEYFDGTDILNVQEVISRPLEVFNGYATYSDLLQFGSVGLNNNKNYGYYYANLFLGSSTRNFLTNAPRTQWANKTDYGTLSYSSELDANNNESVSYVKFEYYPEYDAGGTVLALNDQFDRNSSTGAYDILGANTNHMIMFFGAFPGNLRVYGANFRTYLNAGEVKSYTIQTFNVLNTATSEKITINISCPTLKGYEPIRLTWLNQWGTWDYYTFTQKSTRTLSTQGTTYNQIDGEWNGAGYKIDGFRGGKKSFRVNATQAIKMNSDYLSEEHSAWFQELVNSPEVYILRNAISPTEITLLSAAYDSLERFVTPVRLKTTSLTKKTVANDKLIQYTIEVERSRTQRTQSV
jgi:hypothetical protein